jgi:purine-cytosine permease-like protein
MGWWPSRLCAALNIVIMLGYGIIDILAAGQIMSTVNGGGMSVIVGVIIAAVISLVVCLVGIRFFHSYERWAWLPQAIVVLIMIGVAGPYWDAKTGSTSTGPTRSADRTSFFFLCMSGPLAWSPASADFYVYFPTNSKRWKVALATTIGLGGSCMISNLVGVGIGSGVAGNESWAAAADVSLGALLVEVYRPLGSFGSFCAIILSLGLISNNIPGTYSAALSFQLLGRWMAQLPRFFWTIIVVIIYTVCACAGRNELYSIIENFVVIMGYWTASWVTLTFEEEFIFRRRHGGYDWTAWNSPKKLPVGIAACVAFLTGWAGAVLGMHQIWFTGPLGKLVGEAGIDIGLPVAVGWTAIVFPPLRYIEFKKFGR